MKGRQPTSAWLGGGVRHDRENTKVLLEKIDFSYLSLCATSWHYEAGVHHGGGKFTIELACETKTNVLSKMLGHEPSIILLKIQR